MEQTQEDLNKSQSVADPDLNNVPVVTEPDLNAPGQGEKLADGDDKDKKTVKYVEFEKANKKAAVAEEDARVLREQMQIMSANQQQTVNPVQTQAQTLTVYDQARADLGLGEEEFMSETQRGQVIQRTIEIQNTANQQQQQAVSNQRFIQEHADYGDVVGRQLGNNFQLSPELLKIITEKPHLANAAYSNGAESAYKVVMDERKLVELQKSATANQEHLKRQGIDNKTEPLGGSAAGGGGAGDPNNQVMMTREQVREIREKLANE